jgi:hypothetical protein
MWKVGFLFVLGTFIKNKAYANEKNETLSLSF